MSAPIAQIQNLPLDLVHANPGQPRKHFDAGKLAELADSIRENGLLQPITVTAPPSGGYMVVAGERRLRACKLAGLETIPALVRELDDAHVARLALIENVQREDMNPMETGHAYQALVDAGATHDELAKLLGKDPCEVRFYLRLTQLVPEIAEAVELGIIRPRVGWDLARLDANDQRTIFGKVAHGELTPAQVSSFVSAWLDAKDQTTIFGAPESPVTCEARQRQAKSLRDKVNGCAKSWAALADAVDAAGDGAADLLGGDVEILKQLAREYGRLHARVSKTQRNRALVIQTKAGTA